jgi:uncharacterized protein
VPHATRLFFVADLHGSAICWRKFVNAARVYKADLLIVGGDITAKTVTPLVLEQGEWIAVVEGARRTAPESDVERLEGSLRDGATIPYRTSRAEWEELTAHPDRLDALFRRLAPAEVAGWLRWADERLGADPTRLLIGLGNDDPTVVETAIAADGRAELTDNEIVRLDDRHEMLTLAYSNPTPWHTYRELPEDEIARRLDTGAAGLDHTGLAVFNLHVPPHSTPLDLAPRLDANLTKAMAPGGEPELVHVGSTAVRAALLRHQPLLGLHGHIHESRGTTSLDRTLSINCGSAYTEGALLGAVIDLDADRVRSAVLTSG